MLNMNPIIECNYINLNVYQKIKIKQKMLRIVNIKKHCPKYFLVFIFTIDSLLSLFFVVAFKRNWKDNSLK